MLDHNHNSRPDLDTLAAMTAASAMDPNIGEIARQCKPFVRDLRRVDAVRVAAAFGGLLLQPSLYSNCLRLEALVHLCVAFGNGEDAATSKILLKGFSAAGLVCGHLEDPPEDVFVGNIASRRGNYLVLVGIWESATFYLQRIIDMVDELPDEPRFQVIADSIHALLKLSDLVCRRAGLTRYQPGAETRATVLPKELAQQSRDLPNLVQFSLTELAETGIEIEQLNPFVLGPDGPELLQDQTIGHSELERRPIACVDQMLFIVLPTAVTAAIRRFFIEVVGMDDNRQVFLSRLTHHYATLLARSPLLGGRGRKLPFQRTPWGSICCAAREVDPGRHLALVCVLDSLEDFQDDGFRGTFEPTTEQRREIDKAIAFVRTACSLTKGFQQGLLLVVTCGVGRGASFSLDQLDDSDWKVQHLSAADFWTLGWQPEMDSLELWRLLLAQNQLAGMGVQLGNANGLLNLVAWANSQKGHLIPHEDIPFEAAGQKLRIDIKQNALLEARRSFHANVDEHAEEFIDGSWRLVQIDGKSHFEDENRRPLYREVKPAEGQLPLGMCRTAERAWWFELAGHDGALSWTYERWRMLETWCRRSVPHFEEKFAGGLGAGPILWKCIFTAAQVPLDPEQGWGTANDAALSIDIAVDPSTRTIQLTIGPGFDRALYNPENVAEAALVRAFITGVSWLSQRTSVDADALFKKPQRPPKVLHLWPPKLLHPGHVDLTH